MIQKTTSSGLVLCAVFLFVSCSKVAKDSDLESSTPPFPSELVDFTPYNKNPVFTGTDSTKWDENIRERGYILKEGDEYYMWYTGYQSDWALLSLGYATSKDGIKWKRHPDNPIFNETWTEDMMVTKVDGAYHMFAEGKGDIAHRLTSTDRINWTDHGSLNIRKVDGSPINDGPYGTPTALKENDTWYLLYERGDLGIWLATSKDQNVWTNVQDDPVIKMGPEWYDQYGVAVNQVIKRDEWYYAYYHGTPKEDWSVWNTNVAASKDLINWTKYPENPILEENKSSGILVEVDGKLCMYTMHDQVALHYPK